MSEQESEQEYPEIVDDRGLTNTDTGIESTRTVIAEVNTWASSERRGRRATFEWDDERDTYVLESYEKVKHQGRRWKDSCLTFKQRDVETLAFIEEYLRETNRVGAIDVELFIGPSSED